MTKITIEWLRDHAACYFDEPGDYPILGEIPEKGVTLLQVVECKRVPAQDRLWVVWETGNEVITDRQLRLLACKWAEGACERQGRTDHRSLEAIRISRLFADGQATQGELMAAKAACAAWDARAAAYSAARDAARAARYAAYSAAWDAAYSAAYSAARYAAWDAARAAQLADIRSVLRGELFADNEEL